VDAQVNKIARIFREREQASQELAHTINKAGAQLNYIWRLTLQERHRNARLATSNDQTADALNALEKLIGSLGKDELEPLNSDFQRVQITHENVRSLASEMDSDISIITDHFEATCQNPIALLREEISRLRVAHDSRLQLAESKSRARYQLCAQVEQQSLSLDTIISAKLALAAAEEKTADKIVTLEAYIEEEKSVLSRKQRELDEILQRIRNEERKKMDEVAAARGSLEDAREECAALDAELERAHASRHAHLQTVQTESKRVDDQSTRCADTQKRIAELEVRKASQLESIADMQAREECARKDCQTMLQQRQIALSRVEAAQETTSSLAETINRQQLLMTESVLEHDERQKLQSKLYEALQAQKDSQRSAALQTAQQAKDLHEEVQHQCEAAAQQANELSLLRLQLQEATQARNMQQQAADKELIKAAETEEALRAHVEARMQCYAEDVQMLTAAKEVEAQEAIQRYKVMQQKEREMSSRVRALATSSNTLTESTRLLPHLHSELDSLIAQCIEEQRQSLEAALAEKMAPQLQALHELNSGERLEAERKQGEATLHELESKIDTALRTVRDHGRVSPPLRATEFEEKQGFQRYTRVNIKPRPATSQPVSPLSSMSSTVTPVKASPRDWFSEADMW